VCLAAVKHRSQPARISRRKDPEHVFPKGVWILGLLSIQLAEGLILLIEVRLLHRAMNVFQEICLKPIGQNFDRFVIRIFV